MITESKKTIQIEVPVTVAKYERKSVDVYTCSDGKVFTSADDKIGRRTAKRQAEEYDNALDVITLGKQELHFYPIKNSKFDNEGYEKEFCFYLKHDLSENALNTIIKLVYEIDHKEEILKMPEGWYLVDQTVVDNDDIFHIDSFIECTGHVTLLENYIDVKEATLHHYKKIFSALKLVNRN